MKINILTVTYGKRFHLLKQVLDSVIEDEYTNKIILVDNNSEDKEKIDNYIQENNKKEIILIRHTENTGSAGGFSSGIEEAKKHPADYLFLLDDDNVPEKEWGEKIENALYFIGQEKIVLSLMRDNVSGKINNFLDPFLKTKNPLSINIFSLIFSKLKSKKRLTYISPILPSNISSYGGTILPYSAVLKCASPDKSFYLYFDDFEYMTRIQKEGYIFYALIRPKVFDVDTSFSDNSSVAKSFFSNNSNLRKVYFYCRNRIYLRIVTQTHSKLVALFYSMIWACLVVLKGAFHSNSLKYFFKISKIIFTATFDGYFGNFNNAIK